MWPPVRRVSHKDIQTHTHKQQAGRLCLHGAFQSFTHLVLVEGTPRRAGGKEKAVLDLGRTRRRATRRRGRRNSGGTWKGRMVWKVPVCDWVERGEDVQMGVVACGEACRSTGASVGLHYRSVQSAGCGFYSKALTALPPQSSKAKASKKALAKTEMNTHCTPKNGRTCPHSSRKQACPHLGFGF